MKKSAFKVLCMVLIIALLAPNAFAATPTPETPLVDAATVERVKQEIAVGEISDMEDLCLVAYQHLGADLEEEGMTAYINEDGTLGVTQIISSTNTNTRSGDVTEEEIAVMSIALLGSGPDEETYYINPSNYGGNANVLVYATHSMRIKQRVQMGSYRMVSLISASTTLHYESNAFSASRIVQNYQIRQNSNSTEYSNSQTLNINAAGTYTYNIGSPHEFELFTHTAGGYFKSKATVYIANSSLSFEVPVAYNFNDYNGFG